MERLPRDPAMLLSAVNTWLRDRYPGLDELCAALGADRRALEERLGEIGYVYRPGLNQFRPSEKT